MMPQFAKSVKEGQHCYLYGVASEFDEKDLGQKRLQNDLGMSF